MCRSAALIAFCGMSLCGLSLAQTPLGSAQGGIGPTVVGNGVLPGGDLPLTPHPDTRLGSQSYLMESHFGGNAGSVRITGLAWGRLVQVKDSNGITQLRDFLISDSVRDGDTFIANDGLPVPIDLLQNPVTQQWVVSLGAEASSQSFEDTVNFLESNLTPIEDHGLEPGELGPFTMVPRNAAVVIRFNDLLEPMFAYGRWYGGHAGQVVNPFSGQLSSELVRLNTGYPPSAPFEARIFSDPNHGAVRDRNGDGTPEYYSTRIIIDPSISGFEAMSSNPPLLPNPVGLPASTTPNAANLALRIPTMVNPALGQFQVLRNASGHPLAFAGNGSTNNDTGTLDVVRAVRSGGSTTGDPTNGFLFDDVLPSIIGVIGAQIIGDPLVPDSGLPARWLLPAVLSDAAACQSIKNGDVIQQTGVYAVVVDAGGGGPVIVDVAFPTGGGFSMGAAVIHSVFSESLDLPDCFVQYSPQPGTLPSSMVSPDATIRVHFSEPMDPSTVTAFDSFNVTRVHPDPTAFDFVVGEIGVGGDLLEFQWNAVVPFSHEFGTAEGMFVNVDGGPDGPLDLAGNTLDVISLNAQFSLDPLAPTARNAGFAMRFTDENGDLFDDGLQELRQGQLQYDATNESLLPRPVNRYSVAADTNQQIVSLMTPFPGGVQTPLSPLGSKLQSLWRYADVGFTLFDESHFNVDVEGLSWAPAGGLVISEHFSEFSVALSHSERLPDESLDFVGFPNYPDSGLQEIFEANHNDSAQDPGAIVHDRSLGYTVTATNLYKSTSSRLMLPFPINEGAAPEDYQRYTWRDTALTALGGPNNAGAPVTLDPGPPAPGYATNMVRTIGLPLLMEFRCYPEAGAFGLNAFDIALATNTSPRPNFRAYSTGGIASGGQVVTVDPDSEPVAQGGFTPGSGNPTLPTDNTFYLGEMALVTRVSRSHSIWFDTGLGGTTYATTVVEPPMHQQPAGTSISLAFRAAEMVSGPLLTDASSIGPYGYIGPGGGGSLVFGAATEEWVDDISLLNSAQHFGRYFQVRVSFISNAATMERAQLNTLAFAYLKD